MEHSADPTDRLARLIARVQQALERRIAEARAANAALAALQREHEALRAEYESLLAEVEVLRGTCGEAEAARAADQALRAEAAEALDRAIAELRSMGDTRG